VPHLELDATRTVVCPKSHNGQIFGIACVSCLHSLEKRVARSPCEGAGTSQQTKGKPAPTHSQKSNNLATIILDLRYVTGYGSG
jgi:hypothetical protein